MNEFKNKRVLVTAGADGIGKAIALGFANQSARVHVVDINPDAINLMRSTYNNEIAYSEADVSIEKRVIDLFQKQVEQFDGIDILINCAGIKGPTGPVESLKLEDWQQCLDVNLQATFLCCKHAIPMMKENASGSIINISSTAGWHGYPLRSPYAAAKWAVIGFTKSLAMELGPFGIRANVICPGSVNGARMDRVIEAEAKEKGVDEDTIRSEYTQSVSMRTFIEPEDIADTALFLSSPRAAKITGQFMSVDGHLESFGGLSQ